MTGIDFAVRIIAAGILNLITLDSMPDEVMDAMLNYPGMIMSVSYLFSAGYYFTLGVLYRD